MLIFSSRENFVDPNEISATREARRIDFEQHNDPGIVVTEPIDDLADNENKTILMLVHGINNAAVNVYNAYRTVDAKVDQHLADTYGEVVGYMWPGGDNPLEFNDAKTNAIALYGPFGELLQSMNDAGLAIDLMVHSMGARIALGGLQTRNGPVVRNVFALAAAINDDSLEAEEEFHDSTFRCENLSVFHTLHDTILSGGYPNFEIGKVALGLSGPSDPDQIRQNAAPGDGQIPNIFVVDCRNKVARHSHYKSTDAIYAYMDKVVSGPPPAQFTTL